MDTYIVKKGDNIEKIAALYNIPASDIIKINRLTSPYILKENDALIIPTAPSNIFGYYIVKDNDTLYSLANQFNTTVDILSQINGIDKNDYIYKNQSLLIPKNDVKVYITKDGDTLNSVAKILNTYPQDIVYSNTNIYLLPDQLIVYKNI